MKKIKVIFSALCLLCLVVFCTGCMKMDLDVVLKEDGTASLTSKISIEESAYNSLLEMGESADSASFDLEDFVKETINDEIFYSYEQTVDYASYEELIEALESTDESSGTSLFERVEITGDEKNGFVFTMVTTEADFSEVEDTASLPISDDWLVVSTTVKMPGKISETNGEKIDKFTAQFILDDFTESNTYTVKSAPPKSIGLIIVMCVSGALLVGSVIYLVIKKFRSDDEA